MKKFYVQYEPIIVEAFDADEAKAKALAYLGGEFCEAEAEVTEAPDEEQKYEFDSEDQMLAAFLIEQGFERQNHVFTKVIFPKDKVCVNIDMNYLASDKVYCWIDCDDSIFVNDPSEPGIFPDWRFNKSDLVATIRNWDFALTLPKKMEVQMYPTAPTPQFIVGSDTEDIDTSILRSFVTIEEVPWE